MVRGLFSRRGLKVFAVLLLSFLSAGPGLAAGQCTLKNSPFNGVTDLNCNLEMMTAECKGFFEKNPDLAKYSRNCKLESDTRDENTRLRQACDAAIGEAWIGVWGQLLHKMKETGELADLCERDLECKRRLAKEAYFNFKSDDELRKVSVLDLLRKRDALVDAAARDPQLQAKLRAAGVPLWDADDDSPIGVLRDLAEAYLQQMGVQNRCFSPEGKRHLICFTLATSLGPTVIVGGALKTVQGASFAAKVLAGERVLMKTSAAMQDEKTAAAAAKLTAAAATDARFTTTNLSSLMKVTEDASQALPKTLAKIAAGGSDTSGELVRATAAYVGTPETLEKKILKLPGLTDLEKNRLSRQLQAAAKEVETLRKEYPDLPPMLPADQGDVMSLISRLKKQGRSREAIRKKIDEATSPGGHCAI